MNRERLESRCNNRDRSPDDLTWKEVAEVIGTVSGLLPLRMTGGSMSARNLIRGGLDSNTPSSADCTSTSRCGKSTLGYIYAATLWMSARQCVRRGSPSPGGTPRNVVRCTLHIPGLSSFGLSVRSTTRYPSRLGADMTVAVRPDEERTVRSRVVNNVPANPGVSRLTSHGSNRPHSRVTPGNNTHSIATEHLPLKRPQLHDDKAFAAFLWSGHDGLPVRGLQSLASVFLRGFLP